MDDNPRLRIDPDFMPTFVLKKIVLTAANDVYASLKTFDSFQHMLEGQQPLPALFLEEISDLAYRFAQADHVRHVLVPLA